MEIKINVTQNDIKKGRYYKKRMYSSSKSCPVFQAFNRRKIKILGVGNALVYLGKIGKDEYENCRLPQNASDFINDFDGERKVNPFSFIIDIPKKYLPPKKGDKRTTANDKQK